MFKEIAFIGRGNMGTPMAANLTKQGFNVAAFDLSAAARDYAVAAACSRVETIPVESNGAGRTGTFSAGLLCCSD